MKVIYLALTLLPLADVFGQENKESTRVLTGKLAISYGIGIPSGSFASTNRSNSESGYALNSTNLDATYTLRNEANHYGLIVTVRRSVFDYNNGAISGYQPDGSYWIGSSETWNVTNVQVGFFRHVPWGSKFSLEPKLYMGMLFMGSKARTITGTGGTGNINRKLEYNNEASSSYAFMMGTNIRYALSDQVDLFGVIDFYTSSPSVDYTVKVTDYTGVQSFSSAFEQPVSAFSFLLGISFAF